MVAFIDHYQAVAVQQGRRVIVAGQCLQHGQVDHPGAPAFAAADLADLLGRQREVGAQPLLPLAEQRCPVDQHEYRCDVAGDQRAGHDCLAGSRRGDQYPELMAGHHLHRFLLDLIAQCPVERQVQPSGHRPGIADFQTAPGFLDDRFRLVQDAAREVDVFKGLLVAAQEPRCLPYREAHPLLLVELGVVQRGQVLQRGQQAGRQPGAPDRKHPRQLRLDSLGRGPLPRHGRAIQPGGRAYRRGLEFLDLVDYLGSAQAADRAEERELVLIWLQRLLVQEHRGAAVPAAASLQRQRDQVPDALLRHEVLRREEPVIAFQPQLSADRHRLAQQRRAERAGIGRRDLLAEEDPDVRPLPRL